MQISTGIISPYSDRKWIEHKLSVIARRRGLTLLPETIKVSDPRPGMRVAIAEAVEGNDARTETATT